MREEFLWVEKYRPSNIDECILPENIKKLSLVLDPSKREKREEKIVEAKAKYDYQFGSLEMEKVESLSQGRVWSGKDAQENGLVDALGGLEDAIHTAAEMAGIENFNIVDYPKHENEFEHMLLDAFSFTQLKIFDNPIEKFTSEFFELSKVEGIQARIPFLINIE